MPFLIGSPTHTKTFRTNLKVKKKKILIKSHLVMIYIYKLMVSDEFKPIRRKKQKQKRKKEKKRKIQRKFYLKVLVVRPLPPSSLYI